MLRARKKNKQGDLMQVTGVEHSGRYGHQFTNVLVIPHSFKQNRLMPSIYGCYS